MICTIDLWSPWVVVALLFAVRSILYMQFRELLACIKFWSCKHCPNLLSYDLTFRTHIFMYLWSFKPSVESKVQTCLALYVHVFCWFELTLALQHHCNSSNALQLSHFVCSFHALGSLGSLAESP